MNYICNKKDTCSDAAICLHSKVHTFPIFKGTKDCREHECPKPGMSEARCIEV